MADQTEDQGPKAEGLDAFTPNWMFGDNLFASVWQKFMGELASNPEKMAEIMREHSNEHAQLLAAMTNGEGEEGDEAPAGKRRDPRFAHKGWDENPYYRYLRGNYELNSKLLREAAAASGLEGEERRALDFMVKHLVSATSPANFAATNPEVVEATLESGGENLRRGMENYMHDVREGSISMTDPDAFQVGGNIAVTPGKVVKQNHLMQLIQYAPTTKQVHERPLLIVPPCINKYYILDLSQENSFIRYMLDAGFSVFLVSWVNAGPEHAELTWDDYVAAGVIDAIDAVCEISGQDKVHTLGYCIGGTLLGCALSVMKSNRHERAASMSMMTSFLDFCDTGDVGLFVDEKFVSGMEKQYESGGLFSGANLHRTFAYLRPDDLVWPYVVRNYLLGEVPPAFDILHWNSDSTNLPGRMYAWYLRHTYLDNDLKDGEVVVCGSKVRFDDLDLPGFAIACERDHIVPLEAAYASARLLKKARFVLTSSGHVAGVVNPPQRKKGYHMIAKRAGRLPAAYAKWQDKAERKEGSWWSYFAAELAKDSGKKIAAPSKQGDYRHLPIEDAPGSYVTAPLPEAA